MGLLVYFPLLYIHIKFGGKAIYYAGVVSILPVLGLIFSFSLGLLIENILLFGFNFLYFFMLGRIRNPIYYVLFALLGGLVLVLIAAFIRAVAFTLLGIPLDDI